jgi:hypothetical protein
MININYEAGSNPNEKYFGFILIDFFLFQLLELSKETTRKSITKSSMSNDQNSLQFSTIFTALFTLPLNNP